MCSGPRPAPPVPARLPHRPPSKPASTTHLVSRLAHLIRTEKLDLSVLVTPPTAPVLPAHPPRMAARGSHWSFLEKARFEAALHRHGPFAWDRIIAAVGTRTEKQVKAYAARYRRRRRLAAAAVAPPAPAAGHPLPHHHYLPAPAAAQTAATATAAGRLPHIRPAPPPPLQHHLQQHRHAAQPEPDWLAPRPPQPQQRPPQPPPPPPAASITHSAETSLQQLLPPGALLFGDDDNDLLDPVHSDPDPLSDHPTELDLLLEDLDPVHPHQSQEFLNRWLKGA